MNREEAFVSAMINQYGGLRRSHRRRDDISQEEQLRRIALAQQKRERKELKKNTNKN